MANWVAVFPPTKETEARAYAAWTDNNSPFLPHDPGSWAYVRNDIDGNWVVPYLGPPFEWYGEPFPEPAGGEAMRADGELRESVVWPDEG